MTPHPNAATGSLNISGVEAGNVPAPRLMRTDRLVLRRAHADEVEFDRLHALFAEGDDGGKVFELCGWEAHQDEAETRTYLRERTGEWTRGERYEYVLAANDEYAGATSGEYVGTATVEVGDDGAGEFGFWLRKSHWGRGLCGEGVDALLHAAFERLGAPFVVAGCLPANDRSRRAIEKFVGRYGGAYYGSPPTIPSGRSAGTGRGDEGERAVPHHEWVITEEQYASAERNLSTLIPGVEYDALDF